MWDKRPAYSVLIDDQLIADGELSSDGATQLIAFDHLLEDGPHKLQIRLNNKHWTDTILNDDNTIQKDMLLNIKDIEFDNVSIGSLLWKSVYVLDEPQMYNNQQVTSLPQCVTLGWNGAYTLEFRSPGYVWILNGWEY